MDKSQVLSVKEKIGYSLGDLAANLVSVSYTHLTLPTTVDV